MLAGEQTKALPPPLKWAGGKRWQVPHLRPLWEPHRHRRLVEPFCGGLAVALGLHPDRALLNDANPHLINFYTWVQRGLRIDLVLKNDKRLSYWNPGSMGSSTREANGRAKVIEALLKSPSASFSRAWIVPLLAQVVRLASRGGTRRGAVLYSATTS